MSRVESVQSRAGVATSPGPLRRPTIRDVAELAGVSFKTVSRVINAEPGVRADVVARVEQAVVALGYRRDDRARRLRQGGAHTGVLGLILGDVANPFCSAILRAIEEVASAHEFVVVAGSTEGDPDRRGRVVDAFLSRRVDGLIAVPAPGCDALADVAGSHAPVVFIDQQPASVDVDLVRSDHRGGARRAVEHLLAHGHRDIALLADDPLLFSAAERAAGYREALATAGVPIDPMRIVHAHLTADGWRAEASRYLSHAPLPTAVFTAQNLVTAGTVRALHGLGLEHELAHIGFDDIELADLVRPGITVIAQQPYEIGRRAAELLLARVHGSTAPPTHVIVGTDLVPRGSGEIRLGGGSP